MSKNYRTKKTKRIKIKFSLKSLLGLRNFKALSFIRETTNTVNDANIDDTDEYLNINKTTTHVKINNRLNWRDRANKIPKYVATPLPPLNFNHIGKICPRNAIIHDKNISSGKYICEFITGI